MTRVDLHLHSTASDGQYSPAKVVKLALERQVSVISLTDHDTLDGVPEAVAAARASGGVTVIPGVEISTDVPGKYEVFVNLTKAVDYGIARFYLNETKLGDPLDLYNPSVITTG